MVKSPNDVIHTSVNKELKMPVIFLMGPTAVGKSAMALELQQRLPVTIVSVDSAMVYRGLDIGSNKPNVAILAKVPHHLIDICEPTEAYSAARFVQDANMAIQQIQAQGKTPLLVGGTGLYFRSLQQGLAELPDANRKLRMRLDVVKQRRGNKALYRWLEQVDAECAARIHPHDSQRLQRALEVWQLTGIPLSEHLKKRNIHPSYPIIKIIVLPRDRKHLYQYIEKRFQAMMQCGLVAEVEALFQRQDLHARLPAMRAIAYRQIWEMLAGKYGTQEMTEKVITATRQLAKRQFTWLRGEHDARCFQCTAGEYTGCITGMLHFLQQQLSVTENSIV